MVTLNEGGKLSFFSPKEKMNKIQTGGNHERCEK
jgi:hypothetical protein